MEAVSPPGYGLAPKASSCPIMPPHLCPVTPLPGVETNVIKVGRWNIAMSAAFPPASSPIRPA
eukprot:1561830-Pyramimonas_sp.AAC.1